VIYPVDSVIQLLNNWGLFFLEFSPQNRRDLFLRISGEARRIKNAKKYSCSEGYWELNEMCIILR